MCLAYVVIKTLKKDLALFRKKWRKHTRANQGLKLCRASLTKCLNSVISPSMVNITSNYQGNSNGDRSGTQPRQC